MKAKSCIEKLRRLGVLEEWKMELNKNGRELEEYCASFERINPLAKDRPFKNFVSGSFVYSGTKSGHRFWYDLSER